MNNAGRNEKRTVVNFHYQGKRALVTGASSGIGEVFARKLHELGADVIVTARRFERLKNLCDELNTIRPNSAQFVVADLAQVGGAKDLLSAIEIESVDVFVSNAGRGSFGFFHELSIQSEIEMMQLNILSPHMLIHSFARSMATKREGRIICISSVAALQPLAYMATYSATKAVNFSLAIALHHELKKSGVKVLAVCPGPVATEFAGVARVPGEFTGLPRESVEVVVERSLESLERSRAMVVPGLRAKIMAYAIKFTPIWLSSYLSARVLHRVLLKSRSLRSS